jgi:hypothetical protein
VQMKSLSIISLQKRHRFVTHHIWWHPMECRRVHANQHLLCTPNTLCCRFPSMITGWWVTPAVKRWRLTSTCLVGHLHKSSKPQEQHTLCANTGLGDCNRNDCMWVTHHTYLVSARPAVNTGQASVPRQL